VSPANFNAPADSTRADILAKRRRALVALIAVVVVTLVLAIATASLLMLFFNLLADVMLAAYVAVLLQIKQQRRAMAAYRQRTASAPARLVTSEQSEVRVVNG
jgi:hypothetical protein